VLERVVDTHPDYAPARGLLGFSRPLPRSWDGWSAPTDCWPAACTRFGRSPSMTTVQEALPSSWRATCSWVTVSAHQIAHLASSSLHQRQTSTTDSLRPPSGGPGLRLFCAVCEIRAGQLRVQEPARHANGSGTIGPRSPHPPRRPSPRSPSSGVVHPTAVGRLNLGNKKCWLSSSGRARSTCIPPSARRRLDVADHPQPGGGNGRHVLEPNDMPATCCCRSL
jgi:hypothetical protein